MTQDRKKYVVYLASDLPEEARRRLDEVADVRVRERQGPYTGDEIAAAIEGADGMLCGNQIRLPPELYTTRSRLRVVSQIGVGYDNVDVPAATKAGILFCNTPGVLTNAVAELTMALMISLARRLPDFARYGKEGWAARQTPPVFGHDIYNKTLGIVGLGRIGRAVARRAHAFGMRIFFNDLFVDPGPEGEVVSYRPLDSLLQESDFVSLHVDLNEETRHLIGERELRLMKPTAFLINTCRGPVVDQPALAAALKEGRIAGAALDVLEKEPPDPDDPILGLENAIIVPHMGTRTMETRRLMIDLAVENLIAALRTGRAPAMVNPEVVGMRPLQP